MVRQFIVSLRQLLFVVLRTTAHIVSIPTSEEHEWQTTFREAMVCFCVSYWEIYFGCVPKILAVCLLR